MKSKKATAARTGLAIGAATGLGLGLLSTLGVGVASADSGNTITKSVDYTCTYPLIGARDLQVNLTAQGVPQQVTVNTPTPTIRIDTSDVISSDTVAGLQAIGAATLEGTARAAVTVSAPGVGTLDATVSQTLQKISVPSSGTATIASFGTRTPLTFTQTGAATVTLGNLQLLVTPKGTDGKATGMGSFKVMCTPNGGPVQLASFNVVSQQVDNPQPDLTPPGWYNTQPEPPDTTEPVGTLNYNLNLNGSSFIKGANGTLPIVGKIGVAVDGASGAITGPLTLNPAVGTFKILGFLPVTSNISFTQQGDTTGSYTSGQINTTSKMTVNYANFNVFGAIPIAGGSTCSTASPISVAMNSAPAPEGSNPFNPYVGGEFDAPNYTLPALNGNCGPLGGIVSIFEQGSGNTITAKLTPQS